MKGKWGRRNVLYLKYAKFEEFLYKIEKIIVIIAFTAIFISVAEQVVQRFFNLPIPDTSEISMVGQAVFCFICVSMLVYSGGHITIEAQKMIKNKNISLVVDILAYICQLGFAGVFLWLGSDLLMFAIESGSATTALRIPLSIPYGAMFLGMILLVIHTIGAIWKLFDKRKNPTAYVEENFDIESLR